jgi:hypothetical protein
MDRVTKIFSRSKDADKGYTIEGMDYATLVWFPEIRYTFGGAAPTPVHPADQIAAAHRLIGKMVITLSEYIILWFLREVREGRIKPHELQLHCDGQRIQVDRDGELIGQWPGGFYRDRADLLF